MSFARMKRGSMLAGGVTLTLALLVLGVAGCTSDSAVSTTAGISTTTASGPAQTEISTTTTVTAPEGQSALLHTVTVSGTGHMKALPDQAVITIGVQESAATATVAFDTTSKKIQDVLTRLEASGIPDSAIETTKANVYGYPLYDHTTGKQTATSYQASNSVTVTLTDFTAIGSVLAAATEVGANQLSGPAWQLSDNTEAQTEALAQASAQARAKAEAFAIANGATLGEVLVLTEGYSSPVYYYGGYDESPTTTAAAAVYAPQINPQSLDIYINVTITYQLE